MPVYKDKKHNTWYCQFYYKDWTGTNKQKRKRGFATQREAKEWERNFLSTLQPDTNITFAALVSNYMKDLATRLKPTTLETKRSIIENKLLPYFKNMKICDINEISVRRWQNELLNFRNDKGKPFSDTYLKTINNQLSAILNYAMIYYGLTKNPCRVVGSIGKSNADSMQIWTLDQFEQFIQYEKKTAGRLAFNILFWSGIREGELLALTRNDFIRSGTDEYRLNINKNFETVKGTQYLLTPKTDSSIRCITIPQFLYYEAIQYFDSLYEPDPDERLFYFTKSFLLNEIKRTAKAANLPAIRIHDLRHSHASMLIEMGFNILIISQRLGHEKVETTWQTYAHLYPDKEKILATQLDTIKVHGITANITIEDQLTEFMTQIQSQLQKSPALIDKENDEIIRWDPVQKVKSVVTAEEFEQEAQSTAGIAAGLATAELSQAGYLELCGIVYCLASCGLPTKFL